MYILILNLLSESILDFGKWSNWKYAKEEMDFPLYFHKVIWPGYGIFLDQIFFLKKPNLLKYA